MLELGTWAVVAVVVGPAMVRCVPGARIWSGPAAAVLLAAVSAALVAAIVVTVVATTALARGEAATLAAGGRL